VRALTSCSACIELLLKLFGPSASSAHVYSLAIQPPQLVDRGLIQFEATWQQQPRERMERVEAKVEENIKEDPMSEPDKDPNTWLIEAKLDQDISDWEAARLDFQSAEIEAEIVESSMSGPITLTVRTRGKSPLNKGDVIHVDVWLQNQS
jgi:hypothetical protein